MLDRTAVLAVGVAAGIAIGLSFHTGEGAPPPDLGVPPPSAPAGMPAAITPPGAGAPAPVPAAPEEAGKPEAAANTPPATPAPVPAPSVVPALPVTTQALARAPRDGTVRVGVFGDSFGDGVWAALYHQLGKSGFKVFKFSQQATGFTRYRSLNLEDRAREQLAGQPIDVAVISFGANDVQGVYGDDGHVYALMTPGWQRTVGDRVTRFVNLIRSTGAQVYWVGLPVMKKPSYDSDIQAMNGFYARLMGSLGVPWIETRSLTVGPDGGYAPYLPDASGEQRLMRAGDGIHMSMNGYERLTAGVAGRIRRFGDELRQREGTPAIVAPAPAPAAVAPVVRAATPAPARPVPRGKARTTAEAPPPAPPSTPSPASRAPLNLPDLEDRSRAEAPQPAPAPSLLPPALATPDNAAADTGDKPRRKRKHDGDAEAPAAGDAGPSRP